MRVSFTQRIIRPLVCVSFVCFFALLILITNAEDAQESFLKKLNANKCPMVLVHLHDEWLWVALSTHGLLLERHRLQHAVSRCHTRKASDVPKSWLAVHAMDLSQSDNDVLRRVDVAVPSQKASNKHHRNKKRVSPPSTEVRHATPTPFRTSRMLKTIVTWFQHIQVLNLSRCGITDDLLLPLYVAAAPNHEARFSVAADNDSPSTTTAVLPHLQFLFLNENKLASVRILVEICKRLPSLIYVSGRGNLSLGTYRQELINACACCCRNGEDHKGGNSAKAFLVGIDDHLVTDVERIAHCCVLPSTAPRRPPTSRCSSTARPSRRFRPFSYVTAIRMESGGSLPAGWDASVATATEKLASLLMRHYVVECSAAACIQRFLRRSMCRRHNSLNKDRRESDSDRVLIEVGGEAAIHGGRNESFATAVDEPTEVTVTAPSEALDVIEIHSSSQNPTMIPTTVASAPQRVTHREKALSALIQRLAQLKYPKGDPQSRLDLSLRRGTCVPDSRCIQGNRWHLRQRSALEEVNETQIVMPLNHARGFLDSLLQSNGDLMSAARAVDMSPLTERELLPLRLGIGRREPDTFRRVLMRRGCFLDPQFRVQRTRTGKLHRCGTTFVVETMSRDPSELTTSSLSAGGRKPMPVAFSTDIAVPCAIVTLSDAVAARHIIRRARYLCSIDAQVVSQESYCPVILFSEVRRIVAVVQLQRWWKLCRRRLRSPAESHAQQKRNKARAEGDASLNGLGGLGDIPLGAARRIATWVSRMWARIQAQHRARYLKVVHRACQRHSMDQSGGGGVMCLTSNAFMQLWDQCEKLRASTSPSNDGASTPHRMASVTDTTSASGSLVPSHAPSHCPTAQHSPADAPLHGGTLPHRDTSDGIPSIDCRKMMTQSDCPWLIPERRALIENLMMCVPHAHYPHPPIPGPLQPSHSIRPDGSALLGEGSSRSGMFDMRSCQSSVWGYPADGAVSMRGAPSASGFVMAAEAFPEMWASSSAVMAQSSTVAAQRHVGRQQGSATSRSQSQSQSPSRSPLATSLLVGTHVTRGDSWAPLNDDATITVEPPTGRGGSHATKSGGPHHAAPGSHIRAAPAPSWCPWPTMFVNPCPASDSLIPVRVRRAFTAAHISQWRVPPSPTEVSLVPPTLLDILLKGAVIESFFHSKPGVLTHRVALGNNAALWSKIQPLQAAVQQQIAESLLSGQTSSQSQQQASRRRMISTRHRSASRVGAHDAKEARQRNVPDPSKHLTQETVAAKMSILAKSHPEGYFTIRFPTSNEAFTRQLTLLTLTFDEVHGSFVCFDEVTRALKIVAVARLERWWIRHRAAIRRRRRLKDAQTGDDDADKKAREALKRKFNEKRAAVVEKVTALVETKVRVQPSRPNTAPHRRHSPSSPERKQPSQNGKQCGLELVRCSPRNGGRLVQVERPFPTVSPRCGLTPRPPLSRQISFSSLNLMDHLMERQGLTVVDGPAEVAAGVDLSPADAALQSILHDGVLPAPPATETEVIGVKPPTPLAGLAVSFPAAPPVAPCTVARRWCNHSCSTTTTHLTHACTSDVASSIPPSAADHRIGMCISAAIERPSVVKGVCDTLIANKSVSSASVESHGRSRSRVFGLELERRRQEKVHEALEAKRLRNKEEEQLRLDHLKAARLAESARREQRQAQLTATRLRL